MNPLTAIKESIHECWVNRNRYPAPLFKGYMVAILIQFAILSLLSINLPNTFTALNVGKSMLLDPHYWWGVSCLFGAACIGFEHSLRGWRAGVTSGYVCAIVSFIYLSYDYMLREPPIYAGTIVSVTASIFLGGLIYGRVRD
jgi:hypothetical protein